MPPTAKDSPNAKKDGARKSLPMSIKSTTATLIPTILPKTAGNRKYATENEYKRL
jgi:hypothetical protein